MDTFSIDILNPKAKKLLQDMADMDLTAIRKSPATSFAATLKKLRSKNGNTISLEEITNEVETVRAKRYAK